MAQKSGFFNALLNNGTYDRKYDANDYSDNMGAIISSGVRRSANNDLRVTASAGMTLSIAAGRAWIDGHWYNNTASSSFTVPNAPVGDMSRIDRVVLRLDLTVEGRNIELAYLQGTAAISPTAPNLTRNSSIYELALANINVAAGVTTINQTNITDLRPDSTVCGWVTSPVGYDDYFANLDAAFDEWFEEKKDTLASVTLFKEYHWRTVLSSATNTVTFSIAQWNDSGTDILQVYVNGLREVETTDFTVSGSTITFTNTKQAGAEIDVFVYESIDGTGLGSVNDRVTALEQQVADLSDMSEFNYICNGATDNVALSDIVKTFINASTSDFNSLKINVYGTFGITAAYRGDGSSSSPYRYFDFGFSSTYTRKAIIDFANCSSFSINCAAGLNQIFYGSNIELDNLNLTAGGTASGVNITIVNGYGAASSETVCKNCRFWLTTSGTTGYIGNSGTFNECRGSVAVLGGNGYCFTPANGHVVRLNGGEYYGYTAISTAKSGVVGITTSGAVGIVYAVSAPTVARSGMYQTNSIYHTNGYLNCTDLISALPVSVTAGSSNIRGTLAISIANTI